MNFKPILFSTPMVQAIKEVRKTQTRRIIKPQPKLNENGSYYFRKNKDKSIYGPLENISDSFLGITNMGKYKPGDIMWVRETWQQECIIDETETSWSNKHYIGTDKYVYRADGYELPKGSVSFSKWKPSIFMPKSACRIFLKVTDVRVERVQDISEKDIYSEGIRIPVSPKGNPVFILTGKNPPVRFLPEGSLAKEYTPKLTSFDLAKAEWASLWSNINGLDSWNENPWVWVYDFKRVEPPKNFLS